MRPIKFRIRSISTLPQPIIGYEWIANGRWYHQYIGQPVSEGPCLGSYQREQFTGLLDKNRKEIYEGDIVDWDDSFKKDGSQIRRAKVIFNPDICFSVLLNSPTAPGRLFQYGNFAYSDTHNHLEVIGNIYENPDLLSK